MNSIHNVSTKVHAQRYIDRVLSVVPMPRGTKAPIIKDWQRTEFTAQDFDEVCNIGIKPTDGLAEADLDVPEAVKIASRFLPPTNMMSGRMHNPNSHYWYRCNGVKTKKYLDADRTMLVELRSGSGLQTVVYPSIHPEGDQYTWNGGDMPGEPAVVSAKELEHATDLLAATTLLARHWPKGEGSGRHDFALGIAGFLAKGGLDEDTLLQIIELAAEIGEDEEAADRVRAAQDSIKNLDSRPLKGASVVIEFLGAEVGKQVLEKLTQWLRLRKTATKEPQEIRKQVLEVVEDEFTFFSDIETKPLRWLWQGYIPLEMLTGIDGMPDQGKSLCTLDVAARVSTGRAMPDGQPGIQGGVVIIAIEDDAGVTIKPRLQAAGADMSRIVDLSRVRKRNSETGEIDTYPFTLPGDLKVLEKAIASVDAKLVIIDPLFAVLDSRLKSKDDQDTRQALTPLARLAEQTGAAIVLVRHFNKGSHSDPLMRGAGNLGIVGAYRSAMMVVADPDDEERHILCLTKHNLTRKQPNLVYTISAEEPNRPCIQWQGTDTRPAYELLSSGAKPSQGRQDIVQVLRKAGKPMFVREIQEAAEIESESTVRTLLSRMMKNGLVAQTARGQYTLPVPPHGATTSSYDNLYRSSDIWGETNETSETNEMVVTDVSLVSHVTDVSSTNGTATSQRATVSNFDGSYTPGMDINAFFAANPKQECESAKDYMGRMAVIIGNAQAAYYTTRVERKERR